MKQFHVHLVSDSTGETVSSVARAAVAQFEDVDAIEHVWSLVRSKSQMEKVFAAMDEEPGMVLYTLVDKELRDMLKAACQKRQVPCVPVLARVIQDMTAYLGMETSAAPGRQHELDEEYFSRIDAINYTLAHDDGQSTWQLADADIILVGVSRTSKSPTCVYLANKGHKTANIPYVMGVPLPEGLEQLTKPLIVGLTIDPDRLIQIRKSRLLSLKEERETNYTDWEQVDKEVKESRRLYSKNRWPVIDVTKRSVEETAATIVQHLEKHRDKMEAGKP